MKKPLFIVMSALALAGCNDVNLVGGPTPPVAVINSAAAAYTTLDTATFDGFESYDPDNALDTAITAYHWTIDAPAGSTTTLEPTVSTNAEMTAFIDVAGTYTITLVVVDIDGAHSDPAIFQFDGIASEEIHVEMSWDVDISDVDLHLIHETAGGTLFTAPLDCFYANKKPDWGAPGTDGDPTLDIDDVNGFGPENVNVATPESDTIYRAVAHYYSDDGIGGTNVLARIYLSGTLVYEQTGYLDGTNATWDIATIEWPSKTVTGLDNFYDFCPDGSC